MNTKPSSVSVAPRVRGGVLKTLVIVLAVLFVLLALGWVLFLPTAVAKVVSSRTGFAFKADTFSCNPFAGTVHLVGVRLDNPSSFPNPDFIDLRELDIDVQVTSLLGEKMIVNKAKLDLPSVTLIRAIDGTLNAQLFADRMKGEKKSGEPGPKTDKESKPKPYLIKHLEVRIGKVRTENYSSQKPVSKEYALDLAQSYENVTDVKQLIAGPIFKSFSAVGVALGNLLPSDWAKVINDGGKSGRNLLKELGKKATDALKSSSDALEESKKP